MASIEFGALLGAMLLTLIFANASVGEPADNFGATAFIIFGIAPVLGALWGAAVAAAIHFTVNGTLPLFLLGLIASVFR